MKSKKYQLLLLFALFSLYNQAHASFELQGCGARSAGMGQAFVGLANSAEAVHLNCSGLAQLSQPELLFNYVRPFGLKELSHFFLFGIVPTKWGNLGSGFSSFGNEIYQEQSALLSYSRSLSNRLFWGVNFQVMKLQIQGYGSDFCWGIDFGLLARLNSQLAWGFFATNLNRPNLSRDEDLLPQSFCSGVSISAVKNLAINLDLYKELPFPLELRSGIEYLLFDKIALRSGYLTETSQISFGIGFLSKKLNCDYAVSTHTDLGLTHQFSLRLRLGGIK